MDINLKPDEILWIKENYPKLEFSRDNKNLIGILNFERTYNEIIFMTPDGQVFDQAMANKMSSYGNIIILCGHYKGVDERLREK